MNTAAVNAIAELKQYYVEHFPSEASRVLQSLDDDQLRSETEGLAANTFEDVIDLIPPALAVSLFTEISQDVKQEFLVHAPPRLLLKVLLPVQPTTREEWFEDLQRSERIEIEHLLSFPTQSVASVMESSVGSIQIGMNVDEALDQIRVRSTENDSFAFVTDNSNCLVGRVTMQELALSHGLTPLRDLIARSEAPITVRVSENYDVVADLIGDSEIDALPVVDNEMKLVGVVRHEQLRDVVETHAQSDLQRMVGVSTEEHANSRGSLAVRHRLPWLFINLLTAFLAASVVGLFENLIAQFTALAVLLPIVAGQSGNAGSQAMAVAIRGLALREISLREWYKLSRKELFVGICNGVLIAIVCAIAVFVWSGQSIGLTIVISLSMVIALTIAGVSGLLVPMVLSRFGQDPATASSIILTTITDVVGFFVFLGIALLLAGLI
ncbi:MAG: magnesium transporter [Gammaproteobacteria bacterium]|nr:magnesium transporter [Gammaproteobacteria bacterium]